MNSIKDLEVLILSANEYDKIQGLDSLVNLKYLAIDLDRVEKLEGLQNLVNLEELNVGLYYPLLKPLLKRLGGVDLEGFVNEPQNIVKYCKEHDY